MSQCPTCGRCTEDWASTESRTTDDHKGRQTVSDRDKTASYRRWRWNFGNGCYASDVDMVEWRMVDGRPTPVAVLELTELPGNRTPPPSYLDAILQRYVERDGQAAFIRQVANLLHCPAVIVLFRWDLSEFWTYNLSAPSGWRHRSRDEYERTLRGLRPS